MKCLERCHSSVRNLLFIAVLFLAGIAQAAEIILPPALPGEEGAEPALVNHPSEDIFEGTVLPNPIPIASAEQPAVFDFPEIKEKVAATEPTFIRPSKSSYSPLVAPATKSNEYQAENKAEAEWLEAIRRSLIAKKAGEKIVLDGIRYGHRVQEAKMAPAGNWQVQDVMFEERGGHFSGKLVAIGQDVIPFNGRYSAMQFVPVLKNRLARGAIIREDDIAMQPILLTRIRSGITITDPQALVGKTLKRVIALGMPLHPFDLALQTIITPNSEVEMSYSGNGINVSDRGIALEKGALGEIIRIKNSKSGTIVRARVEGPNTVTVSYLTTPKGEHYAAN